MSKHYLRKLGQSLFSSNHRPMRRKPSSGSQYGRTLSMERLEGREMLSITPLSSISTSQDTGEKPQSKVFQYADQWWTVMPNSSGTSVYRLDGTNWIETQKITTNK